MNQSPNLLGEEIRLMNTNLDEFSLINYNGNYYISSYELNPFLQENSISSEKLISAIKESNNIENLLIIDESVDDSVLASVNDLIELSESLNPFKVEDAKTVDKNFSFYIKWMSNKIKKKKYDKIQNVENSISSCDKMLEEIRKEKESISNHTKKNSSVKFSLYFIGKISKKVFKTFFLADLLAGGLTFLNAPQKVVSIVQLFGFETAPTVMKLFNIGSLGMDAKSDFKNVYLSLTDYNKLLNEYQSELLATRTYLVNQKNLLKKKEKDSMIELKRDHIHEEAERVYYQRPEELKVMDSEHHEHTPSVVHDGDNLSWGAGVSFEYDPDKELEIPENPDNDAPTPKKLINPIDIIAKAKANPCNMTIAKCGDKYYIDHNDLKCYMDACKESNFDVAINNIIKSHSNPDLCTESIVIVMRQKDLSNMNSDERATMESSLVSFEVC